MFSAKDAKKQKKTQIDTIKSPYKSTYPNSLAENTCLESDSVTYKGVYTTLELMATTASTKYYDQHLKSPKSTFIKMRWERQRLFFCLCVYSYN